MLKDRLQLAAPEVGYKDVAYVPGAHGLDVVGGMVAVLFAAGMQLVVPTPV